MTALAENLKRFINSKTKPPGSLGTIEDIAYQIGSIQQTLLPTLIHPTILVFAGDHGAVAAGISPYPQEVTYQMVQNFLHEGAAINVFCKSNGLDLKVVDSGVNFDFPAGAGLIDAKIARSTKSYLEAPAMAAGEMHDCFRRAGKIIDELCVSGTNIVGFGDMGIGNSSSASLIMSALCDLSIEQCTGRGAGGDDGHLARKTALLAGALARHSGPRTPEHILQTFGGFEIAQMTGAMLAAYRHNMVILIDGFISTAAYLVAHTVNPGIESNAIFSHLSDEKAHGLMLEYLGVKPLLNLSMRLGEGTGCAMAFPLVRCAVAFLNDMASFESAGISGKSGLHQ